MRSRTPILKRSQVGIRLTEAEHDLLDTLARASFRHISEYMRSLIYIAASDPARYSGGNLLDDSSIKAIAEAAATAYEAAQEFDLIKQ